MILNSLHAITVIDCIFFSGFSALAALRNEMQFLAASLPEYPVVMGMFGVGPALGPQLMAEIGDVRRFHSKKALVAFAGIDAPLYQSGQMEVRSRSISKRSSWATDAPDQVRRGPCYEAHLAGQKSAQAQARPTCKGRSCAEKTGKGGKKCGPPLR